MRSETVQELYNRDESHICDQFSRTDIIYQDWKRQRKSEIREHLRNAGPPKQKPPAIPIVPPAKPLHTQFEHVHNFHKNPKQNYSNHKQEQQNIITDKNGNKFYKINKRYSAQISTKSTKSTKNIKTDKKKENNNNEADNVVNMRHSTKNDSDSKNFSIHTVNDFDENENETSFFEIESVDDDLDTMIAINNTNETNQKNSAKNDKNDTNTNNSDNNSNVIIRMKNLTKNVRQIMSPKKKQLNENTKTLRNESFERFSLKNSNDNTSNSKANAKENGKQRSKTPDGRKSIDSFQVGTGNDKKGIEKEREMDKLKIGTSTPTSPPDIASPSARTQLAGVTSTDLTSLNDSIRRKRIVLFCFVLFVCYCMDCFCLIL